MAIISGENPRYAVASQGGNDALAAELDRLGLDYELTQGKYGAPEKSFIVQNPDLAIMLDLGRRFGQESVAWSENGRHQLHFVNGENAGMATVPSEVHEWHDEEPQDNFTAVPSPHGEPWGYFTWNIDFNSPMVPSQQNLQPRAPAPQAQMPASAQGAPSASPAPSPSMAKSLGDDVQAWLERLGELRTRELAKAEVQPGVHVAAGVKAKQAVLDALRAAPRRMSSLAPPAAASAPAPVTPAPKMTQAPVTGSMSGRAAVLGMKKGEPGAAPHVPVEPKQAPHTGSQVNVQPSGLKKPDWQPMGTPMKASEYDAGSAVSMVGGDMSHQQSKHGGPMKKSEGDRDLVRRVRDREDRELASVPLRDPNKGDWPKTATKVPNVGEERQMNKSEPKADPLDADAGKHACKGCGASFSPVVAALRKAKGSLCLKCEGGMAKGELKYERNEPQHGAADNAWKPRVKVVPAPGSGGLAKTSMPMEAHAPQGAAVVSTSTVHPTQHVGPARTAQGPASNIYAALKAAGSRRAAPAPTPMAVAKSELEKGSLEAKLGTGKTDHIAAQAPVGTNAPNPVAKAEGMSTPRAPGAGSGMGGGSMKAGGSSPPKMRPLGLSEASAALHKSIRETVSLRKAQCHCGKKGCLYCNPKGDLKKADIGGLGAGMRQAAFQAGVQSGLGGETGMPPAGKAQPKSPAEYDAAAFRPASPGAAGAPSGLELDTPKFGKGIPPNRTVLPAAPRSSTGAVPRPALKQGLPIARLTGVRGAPLSKPKV